MFYFVSCPCFCPTTRQGVLSSNVMTNKQACHVYSTSMSNSSVSFAIQSSTSTTSSTYSDLSSNSNDFNENTLTHYATSAIDDMQHSYESTHRNSNTIDYVCSRMHRRRRKRTIFTTADIEHLKEAFAHNPKPNRK
jgi:hypothetical protein